jgi:hypothetical protein
MPKIKPHEFLKNYGVKRQWLTKEYEYLTKTCEKMIVFAIIKLMVRRLLINKFFENAFR